MRDFQNLKIYTTELFMGQRSLRVSEAIRKEISYELQRNVKDPRIGFVTITDVKMHDDLQTATIYFTVLGDDSDKQQAIEGLNSATGYIRRLVSKSIRLKTAPQIIFVYDDITQKQKKIDDILNKIKKQDSPDETS